VEVCQCYATAELGVLAYESAGTPGMIVNEALILEIVRPGTGEPVTPGEVGEVVVTSLNPDYPMIRLATGDLSAVMPDVSPCGRTNVRIRGWMGRADQTTKVKGMFVHPAQIAEIARRHPELARLRLVVSRTDEQDSMTSIVEASPGAPPLPAGDRLRTEIAASLRAVTKLRGEVQFLPAGTLPNDGKVIADERPIG
jgi:phenylacetate-CoA ligase